MKNASTTESRIPETIPRAFPELIYSPMLYVVSPPQTLYSAKASAEPSNPNTNDTVVEVGNPSELYGGELSRIMLAIKCALADAEAVATLIFDEVDTGVSGKTSQKIGIKLRELSKSVQVLCITHSAQIAALANNHYLIKKTERDERAFCSLSLLDTENRVSEIARIMGGVSVTEKTRDTAREMLTLAESVGI